MDDQERPGRRVAAGRKSLDMTQAELARRANVSLSMVKKVESGHAVASTAWLGSVARVLGVDATYLANGGPRHDGGPEVHRSIPLIRRALAHWDAQPEDDQPLPAGWLDQVAADVAALGTLRRDAAYGKLGSAVPPLIDQLVRATHRVPGGDDRRRTYALLAATYRAANSLAHKLGYVDLSLTALDRMDWAARQADDQLLSAMVVYLRAAAMSRIGETDLAADLLQRAIADVEPLAVGDQVAAAVLGSLHMKLISVYGALADGERVAEHATEARRIARVTGPDRVVYETIFGPVNVDLHELAAQVDLGRPGDAMRVADSIHLPTNTARERATYYHVDRARALLLNGQPDDAVESLYEARAIAPTHFANSTVVRSTIYTLASQQRYAGSGLRALANSAAIRD